MPYSTNLVGFAWQLPDNVGNNDVYNYGVHVIVKDKFNNVVIEGDSSFVPQPDYEIDDDFTDINNIFVSALNNNLGINKNLKYGICCFDISNPSPDLKAEIEVYNEDGITVDNKEVKVGEIPLGVYGTGFHNSRFLSVGDKFEQLARSCCHPHDDTFTPVNGKTLIKYVEFMKDECNKEFEKRKQQDFKKGSYYDIYNYVLPSVDNHVGGINFECYDTSDSNKYSNYDVDIYVDGKEFYCRIPLDYAHHEYGRYNENGLDERPKIEVFNELADIIHNKGCHYIDTTILRATFDSYQRELIPLSNKYDNEKSKKYESSVSTINRDELLKHLSSKIDCDKQENENDDDYEV